MSSDAEQLDIKWNELSADQKFDLEKEKLAIEKLKIEKDHGLDKSQIERLRGIKIKAFSTMITLIFVIPFSIAVLSFGIRFLTIEVNKDRETARQIVLDSIKIERAAETKKYKIKLETPVRDTLYDTISIVEIKEIIRKKDKRK